MRCCIGFVSCAAQLLAQKADAFARTMKVPTTLTFGKRASAVMPKLLTDNFASFLSMPCSPYKQQELVSARETM